MIPKQDQLVILTLKNFSTPQVANKAQLRIGNYMKDNSENNKLSTKESDTSIPMQDGSP